MAEVQDQVGLCQTQGVGFGIRPLLQHFVADTPHEDGRMIAVTQDKVSQITFVPFVEIA